MFSDTHSGTYKGLRVLIVDDDEPILWSFQALLEAVGMVVKTATSGEDALTIYKEQRIAGTPLHLIIIDQTLPGGLSGVETLGMIRPEDQELRAILTGGDIPQGSANEFLSRGFQGVLPKPFMLDEVMALISDLV